MLDGALEGGTESWTPPVERWEPVRDVIDQADPHHGALLETIVSTTRTCPGGGAAFPGGRPTSVTRCVEVDLDGRRLLEVVPGPSPQRVRRLR